MFKMKNGILYKHQKPVFCVGLSYYPSFHPAKVPVPPEGDRIGEMKKDLRLMKEAGFNLVRTAALGDVKLENNEVKFDVSFIDSMLEEADKLDISTMVRIQGYSMNLSDHKDFLMIDEKGNEMDTSIWYDFIQNSLYHKGILNDNNKGTYVLAKHFAKYENMVSYQIYNEPHYPTKAIFDYHPDTINAYREWLVNNKIMDKDQAKDYDPPRRRPYYNEPKTDWVNWRLFAIESMSKFLIDSSNITKSAYKDAEALTCLTTDPIRASNSLRGVSYFDIAEGMDVLGITHYINCTGSDYFTACLVLDNSESAAAVHGKHTWLIEYDARVNIPDRKFDQETYMAVGAGIKGIMYYQWRGDHPVENGPENNGFGLLNSDGTKAANYDNAIKMVALLNKMSDYTVNSEKLRSGAAILYSDHANMYYDAIENGNTSPLRNTNLLNLYHIYKELRKSDISVDIIKAEHLIANKLNIKAIYVPDYDALSDNEKADLQGFKEKGGLVYILTNLLGYRVLNHKKAKFECDYEIADTLKTAGITPDVVVENSEYLMVQTLKGHNYYVLSLNNISATNDNIKGAKLKLKFKASTAKLITPEAEQELEIVNDEMTLPEIAGGAFILLK